MADDLKLQDPSPNVQLFVGNVKEYLEKLQSQGQKYLEDKLQLAVESSRREREAESVRIDKRWAVDVAAVSVANERSVEQAGILATGVATSAETLRKLVAETAVTIAKQLETVTGQLIERIAALEKVQYENQGKSAAPSEMQELVNQLIANQNVAKGRQILSTPMLLLLCGSAVGLVVFAIEKIWG